MNYRQAKIVLRASIFLLILLCCAGIYRCTRPPMENLPMESAPIIAEQPKVPAPPTPKPTDSISLKRLNISAKVRNHSAQFNDLNDAHLVYADSVGIKPISTLRDIMQIDKPIVLVKSCDEYTLDKLSHSYPYLVEPAALLLHDIGAEFNRKLQLQGGGKYKLKVTSVLRTKESVNRLKRNNINSTQNSAHLYGTTFDISYVDFPEGMGNIHKHTDGDLKNLLAEVLLEFKEQGRCLVKFERKQGCFHITSTGK